MNLVSPIMNSPFRPVPILATLALTAVLLASPTRLLAFGGPPGGPFSNGSYFPNDGTFSAVVRGTNLSGTLQFSTTEGAGPSAPTSSTTTSAEGFGVNVSQTQSTNGAGGLGSTGISTIYLNGNTYLGNSQGSYNSESSEMNINFQASAGGQGEGTIDIDVRYTTSSTSNGTTTTSEQVLPLKTVKYFDSKTINGFANCKTKNSFPTQKFKGNGQAYIEQLNFGGGNYDPFIEKNGPLNLSVSGVRLSNTAASFNVAQITSPSVITTTILVNP